MTNNSNDIDRITALAAAAIHDVMTAEANGRHRPPGEWRLLTETAHLHKARRHTETYELQRDGWQKKDGEDHLKNALVRVALALCKREGI